MLMKDPEITSVHLKIKASLPADENKKVPLPLPEKEKKEETGKDFKNGFYEDGQIREIFRAEKVISHCLPIDIEILRALLEDTHLQCSPESKARISFGKNMEVIGDFFLATLCGMQDLSSPTKDQNQASQSRSVHSLSFLYLFFN